jgi:streptomycin 6-kinase
MRVAEGPHGAFGEHVPVVREQSRWPEGRAWLADLPGVVARLESEWRIETGPPFLGGSASWVAPARTLDGDDVVLKVNLPHREARHEASGFHAWGGEGAAALLRSDHARWALLLERCRPGVAVHEAGLEPEVALAAGADVLVRLWSAPVPTPSPFELLADVAAEWAGVVRARMDRLRPPVDTGLVEAGACLLETLPSTAPRQVVLHGDANPGNILSSARGWLAIDAKPMVGDPSYDPIPLLGQVDDPFARHDRAAVDRRYKLMADLVGEPFERICAWGIGRHVEWCLYYADRDEPDGVAGCAANAALLASLAGV